MGLEYVNVQVAHGHLQQLFFFVLVPSVFMHKSLRIHKVYTSREC